MSGQEIGARLGGGDHLERHGNGVESGQEIGSGEKAWPASNPSTDSNGLTFHASSRHAGAYSLSANEARVWGGEIAMNFPG